VDEPERYRYPAFISYTAAEVDRAWAEWLHEALETYRVPGSLVGEGFPERIGQAFLDQRELEASPDLSDQLRQALWESKWLIVVCSPRAPQSLWVALEVESFAAWERHQRMLALLIEGEPRIAFPQGIVRLRRMGSGRDIAFEHILPHAASVVPRQDKTETELKHDALLRLLAPILGVDFDRLADREEQRRRKETSVAYFHAMTRRRGVPHGIGRLTEDEVSHRHASYRFESRDGLVTSVKRVDSRGLPREDDDGHSQWDVSYRSNGSVESVDVRNRYGETRLRESYSRDQSTVDFLHDDDSARAQPFSGGFGLRDKDKRGLSDGSAEILRHRVAYDQNGFVARKLYYRNSYNVPVRDALGNYGEAFSVEETGVVIRRVYLDADGGTIVQRNGVAVLEGEYDARGRHLTTRYLDVNGQPIARSDGCAIVRISYDDYGNVREWRNFTSTDQPCFDEHGVHGVRNTFATAGDIVTTEYLGTDGSVGHCRDGYATEVWRYDEEGRPIEVRHLDEVGQLTLHKNGYARVEIRRFEKDLVTEESCFGLDGEPTLHKDGYAKLVTRRDARGNVIATSYFDAAGMPTPDDRGAVHSTFLHDERGRLVARAHFDASDAPCVIVDGYAKECGKYDERGNLVEVAFFDPDGKPTSNRYGAARQTWRYDERGLLVEVAWLDAGGLPVSHRDGGVRMTFRYDDRGNRVETACYAADGSLTPGITHGAARVTERYDHRGNCIEMCFFGADGLPNKDRGYAKLTMTSDERGNALEERYFDVSSRPILNPRMGAAAQLFRYDELGNQVELRLLGVDEEPIFGTPGAAIVRWQIDRRGRPIAESYCDAQGAPIAGANGYASFTTEYDSRGYIARQRVFDANGKPVLMKPERYSEVRYRYDAFGRMVEKRGFLPDGSRSVDEEGCSSLLAKYDARGNVIEVLRLGPDDAPTTAVLGYATARTTYDTRSNGVGIAYFGAEGQPVERRGGYHRAERDFDNSGRVLGTRYYDVDGRETTPPESDKWELLQPEDRVRADPR